MDWFVLLGSISSIIYIGERRREKSYQKAIHHARSPQKRRVKPNKPKAGHTAIPKVATTNLSEEQLALFNILEKTKEHIFVTGKAGTGKSVLLKYFKNHSHKQLVVVAPTGVAALNIQGQTIHSLFKIKPGLIEATMPKLDFKTKELLWHLETLVIDEVSMIRADLMDEIDRKLRFAKQTNQPFGGVQLIMFGDLYQLPPVVNDRTLKAYLLDSYGGYYFFNAKVWQRAELKVYELSKVFRQRDPKFVSLLNAIRANRLNAKRLSQLNQRVGIKPDGQGVITLTGTNELASQVNHQQLSRLTGQEYQYKAVVVGEVKTNELPTETILRLKKGAQVMFLKNDRLKRWVNGTIGVVESLNKSRINVAVGDRVYTVPLATWTKLKFGFNHESNTIEEIPVSSFTQYPLRLAWAVTIHKSQGLTYESCVIDLTEGIFAPGQAYVALSRCSSLDKLYLTSAMDSSDINVAPEVINFMKQANKVKVKA